VSACVFDERKEWLEGRKSGIGGTDVSAILNLNPWKNPIDVYLGKIGAAEFKEPNEAMFWGRELELIVTKRYAALTGQAVMPSSGVAQLYPNHSSVWGEQTLLEHPDAPFILGTPDGIAGVVVGADRHFIPGRGVEIKTAAFKSHEWGKPGTDEVPHHYRLQVAQYMAITGLAEWDIAALFSGNKLEIFTVKRDLEVETAIINAAVEFWAEHVIKRVPPKIDGSLTYARHLARKFAVGNQTLIQSTDEIESAAATLRDVQARIKASEVDEALAKNTLANLIGENKGAKLSKGGTVQWVRPRAEQVTDWEALATELGATAEQIEAHTKPRPKSAYVRLYEGKKQ
jgi:predicted phage-related endonuclease